MKKIRVSVIGVGNMGQNHARIYSELDGVELVGVVDKSASRGKRIARKYGIKYYPDYNEVIPQIDVASIVVNTESHYPVAMDFIKKGKHIMIEKPLTKEISEAEKIIKFSQEKGVILQVGHVERFNPAYQELKEILRDKKPFAITTRRLSPYDPRVANIDVIFDLMVHDIDIVLDLANSKIESVDALGKSVVRKGLIDFAIAQIRFKNGLIASLVASHVTPHKVRKIEINAKNAYIDLDYVRNDLQIYRMSIPQFYVDKGMSKFKEEMYIERPFVGREEPLAAELKDFINSVRTSSRPKVSGLDGLRAVQIATAIHQSLKEGRRIEGKELVLS